MAVTNLPGPYQARAYDDLADFLAASQRNPTTEEQ